MSPNYARALAGICCALNACFMVARAIPDVAFPFNSQVPTVARVEQRYNFQLSETTFTQIPTSLVYSLERQPAWLTFDGATRTLEGTPGRGDAGSVDFVLVAADSSGAVRMPCTLVVSSDPAPQLVGEISEQLAATTNLSSIKPAVVTLVPLTDFKLDFESDSFIDIVQRKLYYYATLSDHTPLPSWLVFNSDKLTFSGTAPDLSAFPQSWTIDMIASDVTGFAGTFASFTIAIAKQQLAFVPEQQDVTVTGGELITISDLKEELYRDNVRIMPGDLAGAAASLPSWLQFEQTNLTIEGVVPANVTTQNITVYVTDKLGNSATAVINLIAGNASYFDDQVGVVEARAGESLRYHFEDSLFSQEDLELSVTFPTSTSWLEFDADAHVLTGKIPTTTEDTTIKATILAKLPGSNGSQAQVFTIDIKARTASSSTSDVAASSIVGPTTRTTYTNRPTSPTAAVAESSGSTRHIKTGSIVAIITLGVALAVILIIAAIFCWRRRRAERKESFTPQKSTISRPMPSPEPDHIAFTTSIYRDVEKHAGLGAIPAIYSPMSNNTEHPPQLAALDLPSQQAKRMSRWSKRFSRNSQASSMGVGEEMIVADSNIPVWGRPSAAMSAPHDSFSIPAEMARVSRQVSDTSPSKLALRRIRDRNRNSAGNGPERTSAGGMARHSSLRPGARHRGHRSSLGPPTTGEASSISSFTTRGTSVLSTQTALPSEFPRPPSTAVSLPTLSILEAGKRKSYRRSGIRNSTIRMVARSDSVKDDRPLDEKRQSFIRNRASKSGIQSPLFAHGSRGSSSANAKLNGRASTNFSSMGSIRRSQQILASQSEISSIDPQLHDSRRFSQRVRSAFAPNFPRALTRSTMFPDEERISEGASSSGFSTTSESANTDDWVRDLPKPRNERNFVLPGEASPTPPPAPPLSQRGSSTRGRTPPAEGEVPVQDWKRRMYERSSSPLSSQVYTTVMDRSSPLGSRSQRRRKSLLGEPQSLVSADSMHKYTRPRLAGMDVKRPVSVEDVQNRFSSMQADRGQAQAGPGSEQWEETDSEDDVRGAGMMPVIPVGGSRTGTQKSDMSGPAFL